MVRCSYALSAFLWTHCVILAATAGIAAARPESSPTAHVRFNNQRIAEVLGFAMDRSAVLRQAVAKIEASDAFVYLGEGHCQPSTLRSCLHLLPMSGARRMSVLIQPRLPQMAVVGELAHELQHVVEIVGAPEVVDQTSLLEFYERNGFPCAASTPGCWETQDARYVEIAVMREASSTRATPARSVAAAYFGTWTFNAEASWFENEPALRIGTRINADRGYGVISVVMDAEDSDGRRSRQTLLYQRDAREYAIGCDDQPCPSVVMSSIDAFTIDFAILRNGAVVSSGRQTLARDGTTIVVSSQGVDADGHQTRAIVVWDKQK